MAKYQSLCRHGKLSTIPSAAASANHFVHHLPTTKQLRPLSFYCSLSKQGQRFLSSLATGAPSAANRLIRKFVTSSPKSVVLNALSHLLSPNTSHSRLAYLAIPLYLQITRESWFSWNPKLVAEVITLLDKQGRVGEAEKLIFETVSQLGLRERDIALFYCNLIDSHSKHKSKRGIFESYARLDHLLSCSSSLYLKGRAYESMVNGLCNIDLPEEAEKFAWEMINLGLKPSAFVLRSLIYAYGRLGFFSDSNNIIVKMEELGLGLDTVCSNMILSSYGALKKLPEMVIWLQMMKTYGIAFSVRTYNSVLNSCPTITLLVQGPHSLPLSVQELTKGLHTEEASIVRELIDSSVLAEATQWDSSELILDLHGMHLGTAYLIMLQWIDELRYRLTVKDDVVPAQVTVVCGLGKHSSVRGESPVKALIKKLMIQMGSPMRIDRKNIGCFVAKGRVVKDWLS